MGQASRCEAAARIPVGCDRNGWRRVLAILRGQSMPGPEEGVSSAVGEGAALDRKTWAPSSVAVVSATLVALGVVAGAAAAGRSPLLCAAIAMVAAGAVFLLVRGFCSRLLAILESTQAESTGLRASLAALQEKEEAFRSLATHDALTGLPNRSLFYDRLEVAIKHSSREGTRLAVLFLDLDGFKAVNDTFGHAGGDRVLVELAGRILACVRDADTVARLGGDEFIVLLPQVAGAADAARVALKVLDAVRAPFRLDAGEIAMNASVGVSVFPDDSTSPESLVRDADAAMYRAKRGRAVGLSIASVDHGTPEAAAERATFHPPAPPATPGVSNRMKGNHGQGVLERHRQHS